MELNSKHYAVIAAAVLIVAAVLISQFPINEPKPGDYKKQGFFEDTENFYKNIPDGPLSEATDNNPTEENIPLNFSVETSGCLGEIINSAFVPDSRNPTEKQLKEKPKATPEKSSLKIEFFGEMLCKASKITVDSYSDPKGIIVVLEEETIDSGKFLFGPTTSPAEERVICMCSYKTTINVTGIEKGIYPVLIEKKNGETLLDEITIK